MGLYLELLEVISTGWKHFCCWFISQVNLAISILSNFMFSKGGDVLLYLYFRRVLMISLTITCNFGIKSLSLKYLEIS